MAKKKETIPSDDIFEAKTAMLGFIDIFRNALKGDKLAVKLADKILDEWQKECDNLPGGDAVDDNFAFLPPLTNGGNYNDDD
ncbi:MAG: hypothetical protein IKO09_00660, partial [Bacteroidales bacterium]|nr:hypothetical protein [Bacteroidales bacterium]